MQRGSLLLVASVHQRSGTRHSQRAILVHQFRNQFANLHAPVSRPGLGKEPSAEQFLEACAR